MMQLEGIIDFDLVKTVISLDDVFAYNESSPSKFSNDSVDCKSNNAIGPLSSTPVKPSEASM